MSNPAAPNQPNNPLDPRTGLMLTAADHLIPLFKNLAADPRLSLNMAISAIAAYEPESRADFINVARTIAFSMAALALLGKAASDDMPMPEQMRAYARANALNRSADQSERTMMRRRRDQKANPPAELPAWMNPGAETPSPETPFEDAKVRAAVAEAMQGVRGNVTPEPKSPDAAPKTASSSPKPVPNPIPPAAGPPDTAIRHNTPKTGTGPAQNPSYKAALLQNSAMPHMAQRSPNQAAA